MKDPFPDYPKNPLITLAVPLYNEAEGLRGFFERVLPILESITPQYEIVCVNDGSCDRTWELLRVAAAENPRIRAFDLSRNFGKEAALTAALDHSRGQAVIPIDADLQDPPELIPQMVQKWKDGFEVVIARRKSRLTDSYGKRLSARLFYRFFNSISEIEIPPDAGDFRLIDRKALEALQQLGERNRFLKGLFAWVGFRTCTLEFDREARLAGQSKWKKWKLWNFALDGIFAFSSVPLRIWVYFGGFVSFLSFLYASILVVRTLLHGIDVPGYASLMVVTLFLGGIQLIGLGILGEYVSRIYTEVKQRPLYLVRDQTGSSAK